MPKKGKPKPRQGQPQDAKFAEALAQSKRRQERAEELRKRLSSKKG